jgi:hypothetical protein
MQGKHVSEFKKYIHEYPIIGLKWKIKLWPKVDVEKIQLWYKNLDNKYCFKEK